MPKFFKRTLITCLIAIPALAFAVDATPDAKATTPQQSAVSTPAVTAQKALAAAQPTRIGYVDIGRVGAESERGKALKILLNAKKDALQAKIDGKKKQIEKLKKSIESKIAAMTPQQREAKSKEFQKKVEEFQKMAQAAEEEFAALQEKETRTLYEAIEQAAAVHGKTNGFAVIVIKKELLYIDSSADAQDVTDALVKALNQAEQKK